MKKNDIVALREHYGLLEKNTAMLVLQTRGTKLQVQIIEHGQCVTRIIPTMYFREAEPEERIGYLIDLNKSRLTQAISLAFHNEVATLFAVYLQENHLSDVVRKAIPDLVNGIFTKDILAEEVNKFLSLFDLSEGEKTNGKKNERGL